MVKKGYFFSGDVLIAIGLLIMVLLVAPSFYFHKQESSQPLFYSSDIATILSSVKINELDNNYTKELIANGTIHDPNATVVQEILRLQVMGFEEEAREISRQVLEDLMPEGYDASIAIEGYDDPIYQTNNTNKKNSTNATQVISTKRMVSGIEKGKAVEGSASRIFLKQAGEREESAFAYFGGYVGDGNITIGIELPDKLASVTEAYMELDAGSNFSLYINEVFSGSYEIRAADPANITADSWTIDPLYLAHFSDGLNNITFVFNASLGNIGGGYMKISYPSSDFVTLPSFGKKVIEMPSIKGIINLYDSFYIPGTINKMNLTLYYYSDAPLFMSIGNTTVIEAAGSESVNTLSLDDAYLNAMLDYSFLSNKTVPFRIGLLNYTSFGLSDSVLITDRSSSMSIRDVSVTCSPYVCDSDPDGGCHECRDRVAEAAGKLFVDTILSTQGYGVGLTGYGNRMCSYHDFEMIGKSLNERLYDYRDGYCGATCISCGIKGAAELLVDNMALWDTVMFSDEYEEETAIGGTHPVQQELLLEGTANSSAFVKARLSILGRGLEPDDDANNCIFINGRFLGRMCMDPNTASVAIGWHTCSYPVPLEWLSGFDTSEKQWLQTEKKDFEEGWRDDYVDIHSEHGNMTLTDYSWWDDEWERRVKIRFNSLTIDEPLIDFPVLVRLDGSRIDYAMTQSQGEDIRFVDHDGTVLAHEIEYWEETPDSATAVWVKVPRIEPNTDTDYMWMYYGNQSAPDSQDPHKVWTADYAGVWHLSEDAVDEMATAKHYDSTKNLINGSQVGNQNSSGIAGRAQYFDGWEDERIAIPYDTRLALYNKTYTIMVKIYEHNNSKDQTYHNLYYENNGGNAYLYSKEYTTAPTSLRVTYQMANGSNHYASLQQMRGQYGEWFLYTIVYEAYGPNVLLSGYRNGEFIDDEPWSDGILPAAVTSIGSQPGNWLTLNGSIDEFRVSNVSRGEEWIKAENRSIFDKLLVYGEEETGTSIQFNDRGVYVSPVHLLGSSVRLGRISWSEELPALINITVDIRTGDYPVPNVDWDNYFWSQPSYINAAGEDIVQGDARYIQFRVVLSTKDTFATPKLFWVNLTYNASIGNNTIAITAGNESNCTGTAGGDPGGWEFKDVKLSIWESPTGINISSYANNDLEIPVTTTREFAYYTGMNYSKIKSATLNFKAKDIDISMLNCVYVNNHFLGYIDKQRWSPLGGEQQNISFDVPVAALNSTTATVMVTAGGNLMDDDEPCFDTGPNSWKISDVNLTLRHGSNETSYDRGMSMVVMSDGQANMIIGSNEINGGKGPIEAVSKACYYHDVFGIRIYSIAFGDDASTDLMQDIACCDDCSHYYNASNAEDLMSIYVQIARDIKLLFRGQAATTSSEVRSTLYQDSNIYVEYEPAVSPEYGRIPVTIETERLENNVTTGNFYVPDEVQVYDAKIVSYSGDKWTDRAFIKDGGGNWVSFYNLSDYNNDYLSLGDPFIIHVPTEMIRTGQDNEVLVSTSLDPGNQSVGSFDDRIIYTIGIDIQSNYTAVAEKAEGCIWSVEYDDGTFDTVTIPGDYGGVESCTFESGIDCLDPTMPEISGDGFNIAICRLFKELDFNDDGRLFVKIGDESIEASAVSIGKIPYMWGPSIVEVRVWR